MRSKIEDFIQETENFCPADLLTYLATSESVRVLKNEIDTLLKQLKIGVKVGSFDQFMERECPLIINKIELKKGELINQLAVERQKEGRQRQIRQSENLQKKLYQNEVHFRKKVPTQTEILNFAAFFREWPSLDVEKLTSFLVLLAIVIGVQIGLNFFYISHARNSMQNYVVEPLQNRLEESEAKNAELTKSIFNLQKQITFLQSVSLRTPDISNVPRAKQKISVSNSTKGKGRNPASVRPNN